MHACSWTSSVCSTIAHHLLLTSDPLTGDAGWSISHRSGGISFHNGGGITRFAYGTWTSSAEFVGEAAPQYSQGCQVVLTEITFSVINSVPLKVLQLNTRNLIILMTPEHTGLWGSCHQDQGSVWIELLKPGDTKHFLPCCSSSENELHHCGMSEKGHFSRPPHLLHTHTHWFFLWGCSIACYRYKYRSQKTHNTKNAL